MTVDIPPPSSAQMSWYFLLTASSSTAAEQRQPNASSKTAEAALASLAPAIFPLNARSLLPIRLGVFTANGTGGEQSKNEQENKPFMILLHACATHSSVCAVGSFPPIFPAYFTA